VNILAPPKARLGIEIVHDLVCPWCFLGVRRLMRTLRRRPDLLFDLSWRPFLLNPDMPRAGMARPDYVVRKFGGEDRARRLYASIAEIGRADAMVEALFLAHFTDGLDIGDHILLTAIAASCGLEIAPVRRFLASIDEVDAVHADNLRAHRLGINGVPCFVISGRHAIAGAQEPEVIERLLDVAAVEAAEL